MIRTTVEIINKLGLHARAAAKFVTLASEYHSEIQVCRNDKTVNGKSIMGIMMLAAHKGAEIELIISGADEVDATRGLEDLIKRKFDEAC